MRFAVTRPVASLAALSPLLLVQPRCPPVVLSDSTAARAAWLAKQASPSSRSAVPPPSPPPIEQLQADPADRSQWIFQTAPLVSELPEGPSARLTPHDVVISCMVALQENDNMDLVLNRGLDWGRRFNWNFFGGMVRANWRGSVDEFCREARNNPTGMAGCEWFNTVEETIAVIPGTQTRGATCKMVVDVRPLDGRPMKERKFLWTLEQERRPPQAGCWLISSVLAVDRAIDVLTT